MKFLKVVTLVSVFVSMPVLAQTQLKPQGVVVSNACESVVLAKGHSISTTVGRGTGIGKNFVLTSLDVVGTIQDSSALVTKPIACGTSKGELGAVSPIYPISIKKHARAFSVRANIDVKSIARAKGILNGNEKVVFTLGSVCVSNDQYCPKPITFKQVENIAPYDLFGTASDGQTSMLMSQIKIGGKALGLLVGSHYLNIQVIDTKTGFGEQVYRGIISFE